MTEWYQPVRARLIMAQVYLKLREIDEANKVLRVARVQVPEHHDDLRRAMLVAQTWIGGGDVGKALAAIEEAFVLLDGVVA
jgi:hypothetical protein